MPKILKDATITAMSMIFAKGANGEAWAPRNGDAVVIAVKGAADGAAPAPAEAPVKKGWLDRFTAALKKGWLVNDDVPDNIDNDGDGAEDYEQIINILCESYSDIQQGMWIGDSQARSIALCTMIDNLLERLDDVRDGGHGERKGGARHSKGDLEKINKMGEHADKIKELHGELTAKADDKEDAADGGKDDGEGEDKGAPIATPAPAVAAPTVEAKGENAPATLVDAAKTALTGVVTMNGKEYDVKDGAIVGEHKAAPAPEAAPEPITPKAIAKAVADAFAAQTDALATTLKAHVDTAVATLTERVDAVESAAKAAPAPALAPVPAPAPSAVAATVAAIKAARESTSPGGLPTVGADGVTHQPNPLIDASPTPIDLAKASVHDIVKARGTFATA